MKKHKIRYGRQFPTIWIFKLIIRIYINPFNLNLENIDLNLPFNL